jgi:hypothetical protein
MLAALEMCHLLDSYASSVTAMTTAVKVFHQFQGENLKHSRDVCFL